MQKRVTIKDVAELAQVSKGAVSTVLSPCSHNIRVADETRKRIMDAAKKLNYQPNILAKSLTSRKSYLLGYYFSADSWHIGSQFIREIEKVCHQHNYSLIVYASSNLKEEQENLQLGVERQLDGIITTPLISADGKSNARKYCEIAKRMPVIQLAASVSDSLPLVSRDYFQIGYDAVKSLAEQGHRRIGLLAYSNYLDPVKGINSYNVYKGYISALKESGLKAEIFPAKSMDFSSTPEFSDEICGRPNMPTAFVAAANTLAYRAIALLRDNKLKIPEDVSLISCADDIKFPNYVFPELTSFPVSFETIGQTATAKCLKLSGADSTDKIYLKQTLKAGETVSFLNNTKVKQQ